jgi:hypothetical protein
MRSLERRRYSSAAMDRIRRFTLAAVAVIAVLGCVPQPGPTSTPIPDAAPAADLCTPAVRILAERGVLAEAYDLVIQGDVASAAEMSRGIHERLAALLGELRVARVASSREVVRTAIRNYAELLDGEAAVIAERGHSVFDRDVILAYGRNTLPLVDEILRIDVPGDPIAEACPTISFAAEPIAFPPPPTNDDLGLPDVVGDLLVETHVSRPDPRMAEVLEAGGADPDAVRQLEVFLADIDGGGPTARIIDGAAGGEELARAIQQEFLPAAVSTGAERWAGFDVVSYRQSDEPPDSIHVAARNDSVVVLFDASDAFVRHFLEAIR